MHRFRQIAPQSRTRAVRHSELFIKGSLRTGLAVLPRQVSYVLPLKRLGTRNIVTLA